jgi:N utilization substance protein B
VSARSKARKRALDVLYESDMRQVGARDVLTTHLSTPDRPVNPYTVEAVEGVVDHLDQIDDILATYAEGWTIERMAAVDRNVLRIGIWEILYCDEVPDAVAISEAVTLVGDLSTDDSPTFVNGVLARVLQVKPTLTLD